MALTNAGVGLIAQTIIGQGTFLDANNACIGVGNGTAAFAATQTDLQGSMKTRKIMNSGYPKVSGRTVTFRTSFGTSEANFAWNEWGIFNAISGGVMLNRVLESNGTKQDNQTWSFEVAITFNVGN